MAKVKSKVRKKITPVKSSVNKSKTSLPTEHTGASGLSKFLMGQIAPVLGNEVSLKNAQMAVTIAGKVSYLQVAIMRYNHIQGKKKKMPFFES